MVVVKYDKIAKDCFIVEVNPIVMTKPVKTDRTVIEGKTVTTSTSIEEIKKVNKVPTEAVLTEVVAEYPDLKDYDIGEVTLTESDFSNVYEITYISETTKSETTITVRTDKEGSKVTIDNIESEEPTIQDSIDIVSIPSIVLSENEYEKLEVKNVIKVISKTKVTVDKVTRIETEVAPNYVVYKMEIISEGKPFEVTVIDNHKTQEVVAVRSTE